MMNQLNDYWVLFCSLFFCQNQNVSCRIYLCFDAQKKEGHERTFSPPFGKVIRVGLILEGVCLRMGESMSSVFSFSLEVTRIIKSWFYLSVYLFIFRINIYSVRALVFICSLP